MTSFTAQDWILIIGALGIIINNAISNWRMSGKVDTINATAKVIEGHVNSATTKNDERQLAGIEREKRLQETIDELRYTAALLAQAKAIRDAGVKTVSTVPAEYSPVDEPVFVAKPEEPVATKSEIKKIAENLEIKPKAK